MNQTVLLNSMIFFGIIPAIMYVFFIITKKDAGSSFLRHFMGICTLIAAALSIFVFIKLLLSGVLTELFEYQRIIFFVTIALYLGDTIAYLFYLIFDWDGWMFSITKNQNGMFAIVTALLSLCLFFIK